MVKKINIGVTGGANIAERFVIPAIKSLSEHFNLVAIASRTEDNAKKFGDKFDTSGVVGYDNIFELESLEAVYIPLPNSLHFEWIKKAIEKGIHVLVEKSLACTFEEVKALNDLAEKNGVVLVENFQFRFHNQLKVIKNLVESGRIGELRCVRSSFGFPPFPDPENIRYKKELGGGALLDAGAYPLKISQIYLGSDISVEAANLFYDTNYGVDTWGGAYLKQKNGTLFSEIAFGFDHYYQCNIELWGSKGKIFTNRIFTSPPGYEPVIEIATPQGIEELKVESDHHFENMLKHFAGLINGNDGRDDEYKQNINQAKLIEELRKKADGK